MPSIKQINEFECPRLNSNPNGMRGKHWYDFFTKKIKGPIKTYLIEYLDGERAIGCICSVLSSSNFTFEINGKCDYGFRSYDEKIFDIDENMESIGNLPLCKFKWFLLDNPKEKLK